jgi:hypothetical protein
MDTKGGRYSIDINGRVFSGRGEATINPSTVSITAGANMDGTAYRTIAPKLASLELTFDRGSGFKWDAAMLLEEVNVTFIEDDVGVTHLFTKASWVGEGASINTATGEVSGISVQTDRYRAA